MEETSSWENILMRIAEKHEFNIPPWDYYIMNLGKLLDGKPVPSGWLKKFSRLGISYHFIVTFEAIKTIIDKDKEEYDILSYKAGEEAEDLFMMTFLTGMKAWFTEEPLTILIHPLYDPPFIIYEGDNTFLIAIFEALQYYKDELCILKDFLIKNNSIEP